VKIVFQESKNLDFDKVVDLFYSVRFLRYPKKRDEYKAAISKAFKNSQYVVSAYIGEELVGLVRVLTDESLFATVWNMVVSPKHRNLNIGKKLIHKCLSRYPDLHFFLFADDDVQGFFEKTGFKTHKHGMYLEHGRKVCILYN